MSNVMEEIIVNAPGAADPCPTPSGGPGLDECSSTTNDQGSAEAVMRAIDALLEAGRTAEAEKKEALELGLSPARCLRTRQKSSDMEKQCMELMGASLETAFKQFDADGSGKLDQQELRAAFEAAGRPVSDAIIKKCVSSLDLDGDGLIDLDEFRQLAWKTQMATR